MTDLKIHVREDPDVHSLAFLISPEKKVVLEKMAIENPNRVKSAICS